MALLFPPQSVPHVMRVILEAVSRRDSNFDRVDAVVEALAPGDVGGDRGGVVRDSFLALRTLEFVTLEDGVFIADAEVHEAIDARGSLRSGWSRMLLRRVLEHPSGAGAVDAADEGTPGVRDLVFALTWFLAQDAAGPALAWNPKGDSAGVQELQVRQLGREQARWPFSNDTRFRTMQRWVRAIGLAVPEPDGLRPFPLAAIRQAIRGLEAGERPVARLCQELGAALPVLWPGALRTQLVERLDGKDPDPDVASHGADSSVALCLLALEAEGVLKLRALADAERLEFGSNSASPRWVTHAEVIA